jgi:CDP-6-deoxy-D-xylo-4-hexulose-3-dehydrase
MTDEQERLYDKTKSFYRDVLLKQIKDEGLQKSRFSVLQGLTKLRQLANHPSLCEEGYTGDSGKMEAVLEKLETVLEQHHKVLIFSQFVQHLNLIKKALDENPDTEIITFAHVLGNPPNMDELMSLVRENDLILLEDCCDALGSTYDGNALGSFGLMSSCSFYPAHHITCGEGGLVTCNSDQVEKIIRSIRDWGRGCFCIGKQNITECGACNARFSEWLPSMPGEVFDHKYVYEEVGYNLKPIEVQASMLLEQIDKFEEISNLRKRNYRLLLDVFRKYEEYFYLPRPQAKADVNWFAFPITVRETAPFKRSDFCQFLESKKIQTRPYFAGNILMQPAYTHLVGDLKLSDFPVANYVTTSTFFLGTSPVITEEQIAYIGDIVELFFKEKLS